VEIAARVEGTLAESDCVRSLDPVESQPGEVDIAVIVEGDVRVAACIVNSAGEMFYSWNECSQMLWVGCATAPRLAAVVAEVCSRVAVAESAARCAVDHAGPCSRDVVVGSCYDTVGVVGVDSDRRLVLSRSRSVLVNGNGGGLDGVSVERTGKDEGRIDYRTRRGVCN